MGISILELVLRRLREEKFVADIAYPGQKFPQISGTVAAVHIEEVDRAKMSVTVEVSIICPASMGGTACELEALRATEVLRWARAVCVQKGCTYDGVAQVYVVAILATFTGVTDADDCTIWPGFYVYLNGIRHNQAIAFAEEEILDTKVEYVTGETEPAGFSRTGSIWNIQLEELIPSGTPEPDEPAGAFELQIISDRKIETYYHCMWTSVKREFTKDGLRRIRKGISMRREEEPNE